MSVVRNYYFKKYKIYSVLAYTHFPIFILDCATFPAFIIIHFRQVGFSNIYCNSFLLKQFFYILRQFLLDGAASPALTVILLGWRSSSTIYCHSFQATNTFTYLQ